MDIDRHHGHGLAVWTLTYNMDMDVQHGHGPYTCSRDMDMLYRHGFAAAWAMDMQHGKCLCKCSMNVDMQPLSLQAGLLVTGQNLLDIWLQIANCH
jgi:hypothetical protein